MLYTKYSRTETVTTGHIAPSCWMQWKQQSFPWIQWQEILLFKKIIWTCHLLWKRPRCYHSARKTQVAKRIFKLSPIHGSGIYQILWMCWIHWICLPFGENSNVRYLVHQPSLWILWIYDIYLQIPKCMYTYMEKCRIWYVFFALLPQRKDQ